MTNEPFGLPKGTARAAIVILVGLGAVLGSLLGSTATADKFIELLKYVIPFYFGSRVNWDKEVKEK